MRKCGVGSAVVKAQKLALGVKTQEIKGERGHARAIGDGCARKVQELSESLDSETLVELRELCQLTTLELLPQYKLPMPIYRVDLEHSMPDRSQLLQSNSDAARWK
jgi:hypothetical protein